MALIVKGIISGGYSQLNSLTSQEKLSSNLRDWSPAVPKESIEYDNEDNHHRRGETCVKVDEIRNCR